MKRIGLALLVLCLCVVPCVHAQDDIDLRQAVLTPSTVVDWQATATISRVDVRPDGLHVEFSKRTGADRWPDITPPGWDGPIQFTVWLGAKVDGRWHVAASMNVWYGQGEGSGDGVYAGPVTDPSQYPRNLYYLDDALKGHTPAIGEALALFVTAGAQRGLNAFAVAERSDVVLFQMPGPNGATFHFASQPTPPPVVTPPPPEPPAPPVVVTPPPPPPPPPVVEPLVVVSPPLPSAPAPDPAPSRASLIAALIGLIVRILSLGLVR